MHKARDVYVFARTLEGAGALGRELMKICTIITNENMIQYMHWGLLVEDKIFELEGRKGDVLEFVCREAGSPRAEGFHWKAEVGSTTASDEFITKRGQLHTFKMQGQYDIVENNCQLLVNEILKDILTAPSKQSSDLQLYSIKATGEHGFSSAIIPGSSFTEGLGIAKAVEEGVEFIKEIFGFD